jgi:cytochrome b561
MSTPTGYSKLQIRLHWITVLLVVLQYLLHDGIANAHEHAVDTGTYALSAPVIGHSAGGLIILGLVIWRLMLRRERGVPGPPEGEPAIFQKISHWAHIGFYALLIALPITGVMAWGGRIEAAGDIHEVFRALLIVLILGHIGAVVVHRVVWKTGLLTRMTRPE